MFPKFADVINAIQDLVDRGVIRDYAIFGAMAQLFWDEGIATFDLDVLARFGAGQDLLLDLGPLYSWAGAKGYKTEGEHIIISDVPVHFVPAPSPLHEEAIDTAATIDSSGTAVRVVRPEYLIATWLHPHAESFARKERAARLRESPDINHELLADLMTRYGLSW